MEGFIDLKSDEKDKVFMEIDKILTKQGFRYERTDFLRPWGGFFVIDEKQAKKFCSTYFPNYKIETLIGNTKVSPKILIVAPHKRLSWQYHFRRSEVWRIIGGTVGIIKSYTDMERDMAIHQKGDLIILAKKERHRLIGLDRFGIVAEIWQHSDTDNPSDEDDIVRLQDDFARS